MNPLFIPDLLGRPNYWAPELYSSCNSSDTVEWIEFFCQYPRFAIHRPTVKHRFPVSVHTRREVARNLTYHIISGPKSEDCVVDFKNLLNLICYPDGHEYRAHLLNIHPLESMFDQLRAVDELSAQETANRKGLTDVTIELQIISKDANKLISDVDAAYRNLTKLKEMFHRLDGQVSPHGGASDAEVRRTHDHRQQLWDTLQYVTASVDKQKMWLQNYRERKDIAMSLVFSLVTQQDATNNIQVAKEMRRDSSSMNGIALLTMVFLSGTFTSSILGAGIFSAVAQSRSIQVTHLWWFWAAITFPLTGVVLILWFAFSWRREIRQWIARLTSERIPKRMRTSKPNAPVGGLRFQSNAMKAGDSPSSIYQNIWHKTFLDGVARKIPAHASNQIFEAVVVVRTVKHHPKARYKTFQAQPLIHAKK